MPRKGFKQTPEQIAKRVASWSQSSAPESQRKRLREINESRVGVSHSEEHKAKISEAMKGKKNALGFKHDVENRRKRSAYNIAHPEKLNFYVDGKGAERQGHRQIDIHRLEYRLWRKAVLTRDHHTCVLCGSQERPLHVDHIQPYASHPELRTQVENGRTLCIPCHRQTPTYGRKVRKAVAA